MLADELETVIKIENGDRHVFELSFTPLGGREMLVDRKVCTRMAKCRVGGARRQI